MFLLASIFPNLGLNHPILPFLATGGRVLPAIVLFAILAPGFRPRKAAAPPLEILRPEAARKLHRMQRDQGARFITAAAGEAAAVAVEQGAEGHVLAHYAHPRGTLTIAGGWLGAGRRRYLWLPLRPTLAWNAPDGPTLTPAEIGELAADLHAGLDLTSTRHVIEEFSEPAPIPEAERRQVLDSYASFMRAHGWEVTYDEALSRRALKRTSDSESPQRWSSADREALTRMEALVAEMLKGVRSSSRILFQTK